MNYKGDSFNTAIDSTDGTKQNVTTTMSADFIESDPENGSEFFRTKSDNNQYGLVQGGSYAGNNLAKCFAQLSFPKTNFDEEWFGTYEFLHGARVYTD